MEADERQPLVGNGRPYQDPPPPYQTSTVRKALGSTTVIFFLVFIIVLIFGWEEHAMPKDPAKAVDLILGRTGVIDGHVDLPVLTRFMYRNNMSAFDLTKPMKGHVDIPRLKKGHVDGFFWSVFTPCPGWKMPGSDEEIYDDDFTTPNWSVRDTLEQIDITKLLIEKHSDIFKLTTSSFEIEEALFEGRIASFIGVEGGHQLGNSLAVLRMYHSLGVRYMTLTHTCHNAFADSGGYLEPIPPLHNGLSPFGEVLIKEMNRLGVLIDLSHTSDDTARQAIALSNAPVMWSHSSARAVWNVARNVPDDILEMIGQTKGKRDAIVMVNFSADFVATPGNATVEAVADHVEHIAAVAGKAHVGIGSDYDGIESTPVGLEDTSTYPHLFTVLYKRGWSRNDLEGLAGRNLLRIYRATENVAQELQKEGALPAMDIYSARKDL